jgi:hypothetical protein
MTKPTSDVEAALAAQSAAPTLSEDQVRKAHAQAVRDLGDVADSRVFAKMADYLNVPVAQPAPVLLCTDAEYRKMFHYKQPAAPVPQASEQELADFEWAKHAIAVYNDGHLEEDFASAIVNKLARTRALAALREKEPKS